MRLHRLEVTNFRGIHHRELKFPDTGVIVVQGDNEMGKTSMLEALDLLLEEKDNSGKRTVRSIRPVGADVPTMVEAEFTVGPHHLTYRKRWHKQAETVLVVHTPAQEHLVGVAAHERVLTILADHLDVHLWKALRVLQSASPDQPALSGSASLTAALDDAAGHAGDGGQGDSLLAAVEREYLTYFTPGGKPTGRHRATAELLEAAQREADIAQAALDEVGADADRHASLFSDLHAVRTAQSENALRLEELQKAWAAGEDLRSAVESCEAITAEAIRQRAHTRRELQGRVDIALDVASRGERIALLRLRAEAASNLREATRAAVDSKVVAREVLAATAARAKTVATRSRADVDHVRRLTELDRLTIRVAKIELAARQIEEAQRSLAGAVVDAELLAAIDDAAIEAGLAQARQTRVAATVLIEPLADIVVELGGDSLTLTAGATQSRSVTELIELVLPGQVRVTMRPGDDEQHLRAAVLQTQAALAELLLRAGATDLTEARALHERRRDAEAALQAAKHRLADEVGTDDVHDLRHRLVTLRALVTGYVDTPRDTPVPAELAEAQGFETAAAAALAEADAEFATVQTDLTRDRELLAQQEVELAVVRSRLEAEESELDAASSRLTTARTELSDDQIEAAAQQSELKAVLAEQQLQSLRDQLEASDHESLLIHLNNAQLVAGRLDNDVTELRSKLDLLTARLDIAGSQGRQDDLDSARTALLAAADDAARVHSRAEAVRVLLDAMRRHRDAARSHYVAPFQHQITRLGKVVFGSGFDVVVDDELRIVSRTLAGTAVPYESLSGGAKEQLAIITRLACAALVDADHGVPLLIDDALGYSDPDRLQRLGAMFSMESEHAQVIVLTCTPDRYRAVGSAHVIRL